MIVTGKKQAGLTVEVDGTVISFDGPGCVGTPESAAALGLIPAMRRDGELIVEGGLAQSTLDNFKRVASVFGSWESRPTLKIHADVREPERPARGIASFFSGGVDSFYTATDVSEIDALIFVHGFDISLDKEGLREEASKHAQAAARALGKELVEVVTDLRSYPAIDTDWGMLHGAAMAAVAHSLADRFGKVYIPATYTYADATFPWGSHPLTDPLWSTDRVELIHHGADATRFDKIGAISHNPAAAKHLRVCWENRGGQFNCGECEKCTRTMIALRAHGVLDDFATFERPLNLRKVRFGEINHRTQQAFTKQMHAAVADLGDRDLASALRWRLTLGRPMRYVGAVRRKAAKAVGRGAK